MIGLGEAVADSMCLDAIEDALGHVATYADCARDHSRLGDMRGLQHDLIAAKGYFQLALDAFRDIADRHDAAKQDASA